MAALPKSTRPFASSSKNTALGISVLLASIGASAAVLSRATPIAEFDVPKSNPQAIISAPFRCEGDLIYRDAPNVARLFLFTYSDLGSELPERLGISFRWRGLGGVCSAAFIHVAAAIIHPW